MKNKEKFANEIIDLYVNGKSLAVNEKGYPVECCGIICENCKFNKKANTLEMSCKEQQKEWLEQEYIEQILTENEKEYLSAVIKPFRDRVQYIEKTGLEYYFISIILTSVEDGKDDNLDLPYFVRDTMYKNMNKGVKYSLQELGL